MTDLLHRRDPDGAEGAKSRRRAQLVSATSLARRAAELGLPDLLLLGRGEEKTGGREKAALWANAYEAVLAAIYLDGGFEAAQRFGRGGSRRTSRPRTRSWRTRRAVSRSSCKAQGGRCRGTSSRAEDGPSHRRRFRVECRLDDGLVTSGEGYSKKTAQQEAAREALAKVQAG